jgi:hypothetical protein
MSYDGRSSVVITVLPIRLYVADYDRAFHLHSTIEHDRDYEDRSEGQEFWAHGWTNDDDIRLDWLRDDRREADARAGAYAILDEDLATRLSRRFDERAELRTKLVLSSARIRGPTWNARRVGLGSRDP